MKLKDLNEVLRADSGIFKPGQKITIKKTGETYTLVSFMDKVMSGKELSAEEWSTEETGRDGIRFPIRFDDADTRKIMVEAKETVKFIDVAKMSDKDKAELKGKLKGLDKLSDEYEEIAVKFANKVLKNNGFVKDRRYESVQIADTVDNIISRFEPGGDGYFGVAPMNEFDALMIAGESFLRVGGNGDQVFIPLKK